MRKTFIVLSAAAALSMSASMASAQGRYYSEPVNAAPVVGGVAAGTIVGLGLSEGWFGSSAFATSLGSSAAASAVAGGVIGVGAAGLIHAATTPCKGFDALMSPFRGGPSGCVNGEFVGYQVSERAPRRRY